MQIDRSAAPGTQPLNYPRTGPRIARVAGHVVREHEHDAGVGHAEPPEDAVHCQGVGHVPVVEPEAGRAGLGG